MLQTCSTSRTLSGLLSVLVLTLCGCGEMSQEAIETMAIQESFQRFREGILDQNGEIASQYVSQTTVDYFENLRVNALHLAPAQVQELALYQQIEVLLLRDRMTGDELANLDGRSLLANYVKNGWVNSTYFQELRIGNIILKGDVAEARMANDDGLLRQRFPFIREAEGWRFDLWATLSYTEKLYTIGMEKTQLTQGEYLKTLLLQETKRRPLDSLWEPLAPLAT